MFVLQQRVLEKCIMDITKKAFGDQIETDNRGTFLNRIKEITLETFQLNYGEEILLLQQELRQSQETVEKTKLEYFDREQQLIINLEQKLQEQQILQLKELNNLQEMYDEQNQLNKKLQVNLDRLNRQNNELTQQNNQLNKEISNLKENYSQFEQQQKLKNQEIYEFRQKFEQQVSTNSILEQQYKSMKQEMEKVIKEMQRKNQSQIDENIILENEVQRLKWEYEQLKTKKHQESQKYKEALEQLKQKSQNKIREYKQKLKEVQNKDAFIIELQDQIKELEDQIEFQQGQHKQSIKNLEVQYKKQFENLEQNMEQEKSIIQQHLSKSLESTLNDKDREILSLFSQTQQLKQSLQIEQDIKQKNVIKFEDQIKQLNQQMNELNNEIQDQLMKIQHLEQELIKKDQNIKLLLNDVDELRQFSEQTLNTLRENQDYLSELEREKQQQHEIIENIQNQLEIQIKGSFSYKRLGEELEQRCKLYKQEHCLMLEEQLKRQASCQQEIDKLNDENQQNILNFENQQKKLKLEFKLQSEEQMRQYNQLEKESQQMNEQIENLEKQHQELIQDLESYITQYTNALSQIEELKNRENDLIQTQSKNQQIWNNEKQVLTSQLEDQKVQLNKLKQQVIISVCKQKQQLKQQLIETKQFIQNRLQSYDIDIREYLQNQIKRILQLSNQELYLEKRNHEVILKEFEIEFDRKIDQVKREYKLIQEESDIIIKQKMQQIYQYDQSINDLKKQLNLKIQEYDNLQSQFFVSDQLCKELQKKAEIDQMHSQKAISQLQEELISIQQTVDFIQKERQYFEQRYNDFKVMSERNIDQISREYQQQIQQLEVLVQKNEKVDSSPIFLKHSLSSSQGFHRSPNMIKQNYHYQKPPNYGSPTLRTPNKSPINARADKTIEELRVEIHQQKEKLSRMKLNFTESQKKSKISSNY
ncbi:unnamed protein product [Paramecium pentaurelia]|uniref:Uncharacterized protein n=1 Tax=Paramecium pentaurelia TaxID=43138 RepID=A0A8S1UFG1_9CILI|nr:unnamed protein product [Paramecium pentaurelia]